MEKKEKQLTPAMAQYYDMKKEYPDSILFFRMGDFYEMFDDDAHIAHNVLGINVTTRNKNATNPTPLAGIPFHAKDKYLPRLVNAGYKVAICEQISDPKIKGIVKRAVVRVVTPATLSLEGDNYSQDKTDTNYIISIIENKGYYGLSQLDLSSGIWQTGEFNSFSRLSGELFKISPKEVILDKNLFQNEELKNILSKKYSLNIYFFEPKKEARDNLIKHFKTKNLEGFSLENKILAQKSSSQLLEYLETNQKSSLNFLSSIKYETFSEYMDLDESTLRNLDIIYNFATKSSKIGTLFGVLNDTKTAMGNRKLREAIVKPLQNIKKINNRLNVIEEFLDNPIILDKVQNSLKNISDIDTILNRLVLARALPRDLTNLKKSLESILDIFELIKKEGSARLNKLLLID